MQIDHVLYGVRDVDEARSWFEASYGLTAVSGGAHPGWGTANAIVPVGKSQYVELIGVVDPASEHPLARVLTALVRDGDRPVAVCIRPDDLAATARRLGLDISEGARSNPDGLTLRWRMAGLQAALGPSRLPFFIEWPGGGGTPELDALPDDIGDGFDWVELGCAPDDLSQWLGGDVSSIRAVPGEPGVHRFSIRRRNECVVVPAR
jgi:catechol 2,3-dioxygenase-like lactoylglutathione lyase family enzyme